jgi:hypothetical protein
VATASTNTQAAAKADDEEAGSKVAKKAVRAYRLSTKGAEQAWEYSDFGHPYSVPVVVGEKYAFVCTGSGGGGGTVGKMKVAVIELATGKVMDEQLQSDADAGWHQPGNGGSVQAIGNLALVRIDGTHGRKLFSSYAISPQGKITARANWQPLEYGGRTHVTNYHHPIMYPLADGRMFLRLYDGIYCYDLRVATK